MQNRPTISSMNLNLSFLMGRLTRDPELKKTKNGKSVATFSIATNHYYKDTAGSRQESTTYHNCVAWSGTAETIAKYLKKGDPIFVQGRADHRSYEKSDGTKAYTSEVIVDNFQFLTTKNSRSKRDDEEGRTFDEPEAAGAEEDPGIRIEDIPF